MPFRLVYTPYALALAVSACLSAAVALRAWRLRGTAGSTAFALMMVAVTVWEAGVALEAAAVGVPAKLLFSVVAYVGTVNVAPLFLVFALRYGVPDRKLGIPTMIGVWLVPAATLVLAATNPVHGLVWSSIASSPIPGSNLALYEHGPWWWVSVTYYFVLVLAASVRLAMTTLRQPTFVRQSVLVLAGAALPWVGVILYVTPLNPWPGLDLPALGFAPGGLLLLWGMSRHRLLSLVPVARGVVIERMSDALLVLDPGGRIVDLNPVARRLFGLTDRAVGDIAVDRLAAWPQLVERLAAADSLQEEIDDGQGRCFEVRISPLGSAGGRGRLALLRDVTERRRAEQERERLITELQTALADIKTLRGLLPICASCKKIRNDKGYWQHLEGYISEHSDAEFSHGLCPDCMRSLYPDLRSDDREER